MIIQCEQCKTRFKLDDSRVKETGVKVRCSKCKHTFIVKKEVSEEEPDFDFILQSFEASPADEKPDNGSSVSALATAPPSSQGDEDTGMVEGAESDSEAYKDPECAAGNEIPDDREELQSETASDWGAGFIHAADPQEIVENHSWESFESGQSGIESTFSDIDASHPELCPEIQQDEEVFGQALEEEKDEDLKSGFGDIGKDTFAADKTWTDAELPVNAEENDGELGKIDRNESSATLPIGGGDGMKARPFGDFDGVEDDELPPLSIASRRKGASMVPATVIAVALLVVIALAATGYFVLNGYSATSVLQGSGLANLFGSDDTTGSGLTVKNIEGSFLVNSEIGEIFVVKGEVFNNSTTPRNSLRVNGLVYGAKGKVLAEQTVNCGNILSNEQLMVFSEAAVEKSLNPSNVGSYGNQMLQPGKAIPFVIVFKNVQQGAEEFGVEVAGAPVATR